MGAVCGQRAGGTGALCVHLKDPAGCAPTCRRFGWRPICGWRCRNIWRCCRWVLPRPSAAESCARSSTRAPSSFTLGVFWEKATLPTSAANGWKRPLPRRSMDSLMKMPEKPMDTSVIHSFMGRVKTEEARKGIQLSDELSDMRYMSNKIKFYYKLFFSTLRC